MTNAMDMHDTIQPAVCFNLTTPLGEMIACVGANGLCLLEFTDAPRLRQRLDRMFLAGVVRRDDHASERGRLQQQLDRYFAGLTTEIEFPVCPSGTDFQQNIWSVLRSINYGQTITYAELAERAGQPRAIRAAGAANGANPVSVLIPCHRVVGSQGKLTGYSGGLERKRWLLQLERDRFPPSCIALR